MEATPLTLTPREINALMKDWFVRDGEKFVRITKAVRLSWEDTAGESYSTYITEGKYLEDLLKQADKMGRSVISSLAIPHPVKLELHGKGDSSTTGRVIRVATDYFNDAELSNGAKLDIFLGLTVHEACHVLYTEFYDAKVTRIVHTIYNILEDERIEQLLAVNRPGLIRYIERVKNYYYDVIYLKKLSEIEKLGGISKFINSFIKIIRYPKYLTKEEVELFGGRLLTIKKILTPYPTTTRETFEAAGKIYEVLKDLATEEKIRDLSKSGYGISDLIEEYKERTSTDYSPEELEGSPLEDIEEGEPTLSTSGGEEPDDDDDDDGSVSLTSDDSAPTLDDVTREVEREAESSPVTSAAEELSEKFFEDKDAEVATAEHIDKDYLEVLSGSISKGKGKFSYLKYASEKRLDYMQSLARVRRFIPVVRKAFQYRDIDIRVTHKGMRNGVLDVTKLPEAVQGVETVYQSYGNVRSDKLSVILVIDESGSMSGDAIRAAKDTAILINEALKDNKTFDLYIYGHTADVYSRTPGEYSTDITIYKEKGFSPKYSLGSVSAKSQNRDGSAITEVVNRFRMLSKRNAIMFYIADGEPCATDYYGEEAIEDVKRAVKKAEASNVHIINIAIESSYNPSLMFKHFVKLTNLSTLHKDLSQLMKKIVYKTQKINYT